jgi:DNA-binding NarL/FixJ family response regulator
MAGLDLAKNSSTRIKMSETIFDLSSREYEIVKLTAQGLSNKDIALKMHLSEITVKKYLYRIYEKVGVKGKTQLLIFALKNNLQ